MTGEACPAHSSTFLDGPAMPCIGSQDPVEELSEASQAFEMALAVPWLKKNLATSCKRCCRQQAPMQGPPQRHRHSFGREAGRRNGGAPLGYQQHLVKVFACTVIYSLPLLAGSDLLKPKCHGQCKFSQPNGCDQAAPPPESAYIPISTQRIEASFSQCWSKF